MAARRLFLLHDESRPADLELIFAKYGADPDQYLAVESNLHTQKMYTELGIRGFKVFPVSE